MSFLKSQNIITITATTMRMPTQTPALKIPPITSQLVIVSNKRVKIMILDVIRFFILSMWFLLKPEFCRIVSDETKGCLYVLMHSRP